MQRERTGHLLDASPKLQQTSSQFGMGSSSFQPPENYPGRKTTHAHEVREKVDRITELA